MRFISALQAATPEFKRKNIVLAKKSKKFDKEQLKSSALRRVLILNSNQIMANEITAELKEALPDCSILYVPTIFLAKKIIKHGNYDLIISSPILPDGSVTNLQASLKELTRRPDLVVLGNLSVKLKNELAECFVNSSGEYKSTTAPCKETNQQSKVQAKLARIRQLGADLRNDLNNPLQEIVTMLFVAQNLPNQDAEPGIKEALQAIERASQNMATVVKGLEGKISKAVI